MMKKLSFWLIALVVSFSLVSPGFTSNVESLLPDERNTIEVFQKASPKVVYVNRLATVTRSLHKMNVPDGEGSGIIWDDKGHIVTNYHVIKGADDLSITLGNKLTVHAKVIGKEPRKDIAVLQVQSPEALAYLKAFKPFEIVHLNELTVGQKAIAIGNPYGLDHSLSKGVISALGRQVPGIGGVTINNMIQTDTPINPGNSGGPLLNSAGKLIGLNTMIYSRSGASAGVGFAVPADEIQRVVTQIIKHGRVVLAGIGIQRVEPSAAKQMGVKKGILIAKVIPNTPASHMHLRGTSRDPWGHVIMGDVIVALNSYPVENYDELYNRLTEIKVGEFVTLSIKRGNKEIDVKMKTIDIAAL